MRKHEIIGCAYYLWSREVDYDASRPCLDSFTAGWEAANEHAAKLLRAAPDYAASEFYASVVEANEIGVR